MRWICAIAMVLAAAPALALDRIELRHEGRPRQIEGKILVKAEDGGLLFLARDGKIWPVKPQELLSHREDKLAFSPYSKEELSSRLLKELPEGFQIHETRNYLICYNTSDGYAEWCGALFERLYKGFTNFWEQRGFEFDEPEFPLVAIIFDHQNAYREYSRPELGDSADRIIGYYSFRSNHMVMYDLTGGSNRDLNKAAEINRVLSRPQAERTVATIIHEATHQIAYNCGLQTRYADNPLWLSEGLAMYFETPDLRSNKGWRTIGAVNRVRLAQFRNYLPRRPENSLSSLIQDDKRCRDPRQINEAYAEAWALTYFLVRAKPKEFSAYLKALADKPRLIWDEPAERLSEFKKHFGDLDSLERDFLRTVRRIR